MFKTRKNESVSDLHTVALLRANHLVYIGVKEKIIRIRNAG